MAELLATDVQYILNSIPLTDYQKAFALDTSLIERLGGFRPGPGRIQVPFHYAGNTTANSFDESTDLSTAGNQSRRVLSQDYKRVYCTFGVGGLVEAISKAGGYVKISDIVMEEAVGAVEDLMDEINTQLLGDGTGNSNLDLHGILHHISDDVTWMGLAKGSYAWIQSYCLDNSGDNRALTKDLMRSVGNALKFERKSNYSAIYTGVAVRDAYEDMLGDSKRYVNITKGDVVVQELAFDGRPVLAFPGYTANRMDFVREQDFEILYLPQTVRDSLNREVTGIFKVENMPKVTDVATFRVIAYLDLVCKNPWKQGCLDDVE